MKWYVCILLLGVLEVAGCRQNSQEHALEVTYIANEGFMIAMGGTKVLIDPLSRSKYYLGPSDTLVARLMDDGPPFDNIDYVLVTHDHPDHFDAEMMSRFLLKHPAVQFIANSEACSRLTGDGIATRHRSGVDPVLGQYQSVDGDKAEVVVLRLVHGGNPDVSNLAFLVRSNGYTFMHVGDARLSTNEEYLRTVDWSSYSVDILFLEYFDQSSETQAIIEKLIRPKHVVLMHIPGGEEGNVRNERGKIHPRTVVFSREGETKRFDSLADGGSSR